MFCVTSWHAQWLQEECFIFIDVYKGVVASFVPKNNREWPAKQNIVTEYRSLKMTTSVHVPMQFVSDKSKIIHLFLFIFVTLRWTVAIDGMISM